MGKFKIGDFLAKKCRKMANFALNPVFCRFLTNNFIFCLSLVSSENFLKSSPMCLLVCRSSGIHGKVQNWRFFGENIGIFDKNPVF